MIRQIHLHGGLGRRFGRLFELAVQTPAEAIRALSHMLPGFREAIAEGDWRVVRGRQGLDENGVQLRFGASRELHLVPVPAGRKNAAVGKIVVGVVLIAAAVVTAGAALSAAPAGAGLFGTTLTSGAVLGTSAVGVAGIATVGQLAFLGVGLVLAGASALLAPQPKSERALQAEQNPSFIFGGPVNTAAQGQAMPLVYGRVRVGSVVGAASLEAVDYVAAPAVTGGVTATGKLTGLVAART